MRGGPRVVWLTAAGLVFAIVLVVLALRLASSPEARRALTNDQWQVGSAARLARAIDRDGPILFPDPRGGSRDIYVQHLGADSETGWHVFAARVTGSRRTCQLRWQRKEGHFSDPCTRRTHPADGAGLPSFPVKVDDNKVLTVTLTSS